MTALPMSPTPCFVFGSNREGRHGKGAALKARHFHGAIYGKAEGLMGPGSKGYCYGIITKELRRTEPPVLLPEVREGIQKFLEFAATDHGMRYQYEVSPIGCGLAGFTPKEIGDEFTEVLMSPIMYSHVHLPSALIHGMVAAHLDHGAKNYEYNDPPMNQWTVDELISDIVAFDETFAWYGSSDDPQDPEGSAIYRQIRDRYSDDFRYGVELWLRANKPPVS